MAQAFSLYSLSLSLTHTHTLTLTLALFSFSEDYEERSLITAMRIESVPRGKCKEVRASKEDKFYLFIERQFL